ncbi:sulfurtransferase TusA [Marinobacter changyiensis]|uniref:sulfurtransferase TusA n=1 Tax=Marinobacter changyiensis TaxID=2604091 RepID=UPI0012654F97|nr:sulfurtransferase TusA [Marinobacter changyiensis]
MDEPDFDLELDARGLMCPEPVMLLHGKMSELVEGGILKIVATDPSTTRDVPRFCQFLNHELMLETHSGEEFIFFIRRG